MRGHYVSNWLGEPEWVRYTPDPDEEYERQRDEIEIQDAIDAQQMALFGQMELLYETV